MIKRIKYISAFADDLSRQAIVDIAFAAARRNAELDITGILIASGGLFFQIIEGPVNSVNELYGAILTDPRHQQVVTLSVQVGDMERLFPEWRMELLNLDETAGDELRPLKAIVNAVYTQSKLTHELTDTLAHAAWRELKRHSIPPGAKV